MVWVFIAAAFVLRPNSSLAGVLGSSGWASAGSGRGLRLPLSCANAASGGPTADTSKTLQPRVFTRVFTHIFRDRRAIVMGNLLGSCLAIPPPRQRQRTPNATPEEYVRLPTSQLRPVGCVVECFGEFLL